jgi:hypothetical protein
MSISEQPPLNPSEEFGQNEAHFAYLVAASLTGSSERVLEDRASDAVRTATRQHEKEGEIDVSQATAALIGKLVGDFTIGSASE